MYRDAVPEGTGMLFVFDREALRSFWMQNTYVALDVAFIDANFTIVDIQQMEPETTDIHDGARPAMFALEVRQGVVRRKGHFGRRPLSGDLFAVDRKASAYTPSQWAVTLLTRKDSDNCCHGNRNYHGDDGRAGP